MKRDGKKHWLKQKGCRNCAYQWITTPHYFDCEPNCKDNHGHFVILPMIQGKQFEYISRPFNLESWNLKNCYFNSKGELVHSLPTNEVI